MESDWQLKCKNLKERIYYMYKSGQWTDCTFLVGLKPDREKIGCHKYILASASPMFAAMFYGEMAARQRAIPIPDVQPEAFRRMLEYIYNDDEKLSGDISFDVGCDLYYAANKYNLPRIKEMWVERLHLILNDDIDSTIPIYEFASHYEEKTLMWECLNIMRTQTQRILESKGFISAEVSTVLFIFSLEDTNCSEGVLFNGLVRYLKAQEVIKESTVQSHPTDCSKRSIENSTDSSYNSASDPLEDFAVLNVETNAESTPQSQASGGQKESEEKSIARVLLEKIRFLTFTADQFALGPAQSGLLTESEAYAILMNILTESSPVLMPSGFCTSRKTRYVIEGLTRFSIGQSTSPFRRL